MQKDTIPTFTSKEIAEEFSKNEKRAKRIFKELRGFDLEGTFFGFTETCVRTEFGDITTITTLLIADNKLGTNGVLIDISGKPKKLFNSLDEGSKGRFPVEYQSYDGSMAVFMLVEDLHDDNLYFTRDGRLL